VVTTDGQTLNLLPFARNAHRQCLNRPPPISLAGRSAWSGWLSLWGLSGGLTLCSKPAARHMPAV
jgi:hypothetical protein